MAAEDLNGGINTRQDPIQFGSGHSWGLLELSNETAQELQQDHAGRLRFIRAQKISKNSCDGSPSSIRAANSACVNGSITHMKTNDYIAMLRAVESALEICSKSTGFMDAMHRKICEELHDARDRLLKLISTTGPKSLGH